MFLHICEIFTNILMNYIFTRKEISIERKVFLMLNVTSTVVKKNHFPYGLDVTRQQ